MKQKQQLKTPRHHAVAELRDEEVRNSITHPCLELIKASWTTAVVLLKTVVVKQRHSAKSSSAKREKEAIPGVPQNSILKPFTVCFSGDPLISSNLFQIS